jgi:hypothetical protein
MAAKVKSLEQIHEEEVDGYTDQLMAALDAATTPEARRAAVRSLVEWLV